MKLHWRMLLTVGLVGVFLSIPVLGQKVETDYDHSVNFERYHTYSWGHIHATDPFFEQRMRDAIDHTLQAKGWQEVPTGGDATVTAVAVKKNKAEYTTFYNGFGPGWRWHGWGPTMATTTVDNIAVGTVVVDIYDTNSLQLVWRGLAHEELSDKPEKDTQKLQKAVDKMFDKFPPKAS